MDEHGDSYITL